MLTRDRRSQRIRTQLQAHPNPRSGQQLLPRSLHDQLKRVYGGDNGDPADQAALAVAAELARLTRRRR